MFSFLRPRLTQRIAPITTDVHSHLLAGIDDGVQSKEQALTIIRTFMALGYRKVITTPHVMQDYYRNNPAIILSRLEELRNYLVQEGVSFEIEAAAEYYLDEAMLDRLEKKEPLLTFGNRLVLFETNMFSEPLPLKDFIFKLNAAGYKPVMAHPERYAYLTMDKAEDLKDRGVLFQVNILSLIGYYSKPIQRMAQQLINKGWIDLLGSDCHNEEHAQLIEHAQKNKYYQKALELPLLNHTI